MRKLIMKMSMSIDGFVAGPNGELDWMFKSGDEESSAWVLHICQSAGLHIMGRKTFNDMTSYWPTSTSPFAKPMNEIPKALFTTKGFHPSGTIETSKAVEHAKEYDEIKGISPEIEQSPAAISWTHPRVFQEDTSDRFGSRIGNI